MKQLYLLVFLFLVSANCFAQDSAAVYTKISGTVKGDSNKALEGANLVIEGSIDGATTDEKGYFEFETKKTGQQNLIITAVDYTEKVQVITIEPGKELVLDVKISKAVIETDVIIVTASSFTSGSNSQVTLTPMEIVRIPGADADLYRAITTFPGSNQVDEGSRIAVRGGEPSEVLTFLDQATLYNPFIFDGAYNTSSYSTINPWGLTGINFSSGGFSAKFGNALSAVLDLKSFDMPQTTGMFAILGLANAGLSGVFLSNNGRLGATFNAGHTFLKPFLLVNGEDQTFGPTPTARELGGTLSYKFSDVSLLKLYAVYNDDKIGVESESPTFKGFFKTETQSIFTNLKYSTAPGSSSMLNIGASFNYYDRSSAYSILDTRTNDIFAKVRADFSMPVNTSLHINAGAEYEYFDYKISGTVPERSYDLRSTAPVFNLDTKTNTGRVGAYAETQLKVVKDFYAITGVRSDYHTLSKEFSVDPRLSLVYRFSEKSFLKGATGIYHQYPVLSEYEQSIDNSLKPEQAVHYILGYEYNDDNDMIVRLEGYYKDYSKLSYTGPGFLNESTGSGFARGVDLFIKKRVKGRFTGWLSYSYTDSKRRISDSSPEFSANYDITHSESIVGTYNFSDTWTAGLTYKISTGKPYTPVTSAAFSQSEGVYIPGYAGTNSSRFPTYHRLDMNLQHIFALFGKFAVAFFALNNVLNQKNVYTYTYNFDYSIKKEVISSNDRIVYFGIGLQL
jgi:hypothetical protein